LKWHCWLDSPGRRHFRGDTSTVAEVVVVDPGLDAKKRINRADAAMYLAKKQALGGYVFHADHSLGESSLPAPSVQTQHERLSHYELEMTEHEQRHPPQCRTTPIRWRHPC
jgi:hypothetical protein